MIGHDLHNFEIVMKHTDFIVWMIAFPISQAIIDAIRWNFCQQREYSEGVRGFSALIVISIWLSIGFMLW